MSPCRGKSTGGPRIWACGFNLFLVDVCSDPEDSNTIKPAGDDFASAAIFQNTKDGNEVSAALETGHLRCGKESTKTLRCERKWLHEKVSQNGQNLLVVNVMLIRKSRYITSRYH